MVFSRNPEKCGFLVEPTGRLTGWNLYSLEKPKGNPAGEGEHIFLQEKPGKYGFLEKPKGNPAVEGAHMPPGEAREVWFFREAKRKPSS